MTLFKPPLSVRFGPPRFNIYLRPYKDRRRWERTTWTTAYEGAIPQMWNSRFSTATATMPATQSNKKRTAEEAVLAPATSKKRKMEVAQKYYAVKAGFKPGVYLTYAECSEQTAGFKGAVFKSFLSRQDAESFVAGKKVLTPPGEPEKYYAVAVGNPTGIYQDWSEASMAIKGVKGPKYKRFATRPEAIEFIKQFGSKEAVEALGIKTTATTQHAPLDLDAKVLSWRQEVRNEIQDHLQGKSGVSKESVDDLKRYTHAAKETEDVIHVYTDGSSLANGKAGSRAGVGVYFGDGDHRNISERLVGDPQTNQRAELMAILKALQVVPLKQSIQIITDSQYAIDCVTKWSISWKKKGWATATGQEVKNQDIIRPILDKMDEKLKVGGETTFKWVKGHASNRGNMAADLLAVRGAKLP